MLNGKEELRVIVKFWLAQQDVEYQRSHRFGGEYYEYIWDELNVRCSETSR